MIGLIILLSIGLLFRLIFFIHSTNSLPISTDEAYVGLMARHILSGEFPLVYWGTGYQGPIESYINAPLFYFLDFSPLSIRIFTLIWSILFLLLTFKLGKEIFGEEVGLLSMLFVTIPPGYITLAGALTISPYDTFLLVFGNIILLVGFNLVYKSLDERKRVINFSILGLLSGLVFWAHMISIYYIITILIFLFLKDKLFFIKKESIVGFIFFLIGSLPLWIYNITHHFDSFALTKSVDFSEMLEKSKTMLTFTLPAILGFYTSIYIDYSGKENYINLPFSLGVSFGIILIIFLLYFLIIRRKGLSGLLKLSLKYSNGFEMLFVFLLIVFFAFIRTKRSDLYSLRYLEPIYSVIPILLGYGTYKIYKRSKIIAIIFISIILCSYLYANISIYRSWGDKKIAEEKFDLPNTKELVGFLKNEGIDRGYSHFWLAYRLTFETNEEIVISPAYDERFGRYRPRYFDEVASSPNVAYIFQKGLGTISADNFEESLKMIGGDYRKRGIGRFTVFYLFKSPFVEIPRTGWAVSSNYNSQKAAFAIDGDISTRWGTGHPQVRGMNFEIEIPRPSLLTKIEINLGKFKTDHPRGLDIEVSEDRVNWKRVVFTQKEDILRWDKEQPRYFMRGDPIILTYLFEPVRARFVRLFQTGSDPVFDWSIPEISLYSPAGG